MINLRSLSSDKRREYVNSAKLKGDFQVSYNGKELIRIKDNDLVLNETVKVILLTNAGTRVPMTTVSIREIHEEVYERYLILLVDYDKEDFSECKKYLMKREDVENKGSIYISSGSYQLTLVGDKLKEFEHLDELEIVWQ